MRRGIPTLLAIGWAGLVAAGCTSSGHRSEASTTSGSSTRPASSADATSAPLESASGSLTTSRPMPTESRPRSADAALRALDSMSLAERVGQLLMVDCPTTGVTEATRSAVEQDHAGSVILDLTTHRGLAAIQGVTADLRSLAPTRTGLFVATDQEGGEVQRLQGAGFSAIPSGTEQGRVTPSKLKADATTWGSQLRDAGVNLNLAPVLDTVPAGQGSNPPIGDLDREYGATPAAVAAHSIAYAQGMQAAGVDATAKHFPGLGRVSGNTDDSAGVTDRITTRHDPDLLPFEEAIDANIPFVMVSSAIYARIDPGRPAAFSSTIIDGMLRGDLGFHGVVISDDLGTAEQVRSYSLGQRAVDFVQAGGDMVLTVDASAAGPMSEALLGKAEHSAAFRATVDDAALHVLEAKAARGLLR